MCACAFALVSGLCYALWYGMQSRLVVKKTKKSADKALPNGKVASVAAAACAYISQPQVCCHSFSDPY